MSTTLQRDPPTARGAAAERSLIALAAAVLVGIYALGKVWPRLTFNPVGSAWLGDTFVFVAAAMLLGLMLLGPARSRTTPRRRLALVALRLAVVLLILLMMLRPALVYTAVSRLPATIVILIDTSGSMKATDVAAQSRYERLREVLQDAKEALADLAEHITIKAYAFDADLKELSFSGGSIELPESADGEQTALGWAMGEVLKRETPHRLVGVVLLSDANQRALSPRDDDPTRVAEQRMKGRNYPVFGVIFGRTEGQVTQRDLVLETLKANDSVHVKNRLAIAGEARIVGFPDPTIPAQLLVEQAGEMKIVETVQFPRRDGGQLTPFDLSYAFDKEGLYKMTLRLPERDGEFDTANNEQSTIVRVTKGGLAVLYIEGAVRLEARNILRSLGSGENIEADFVRLDAQHPDRRSPAAAQTLAEGLKPGKYERLHPRRRGRFGLSARQGRPTQRAGAASPASSRRSRADHARRPAQLRPGRLRRDPAPGRAAGPHGRDGNPGLRRQAPCRQTLARGRANPPRATSRRQFPHAAGSVGQECRGVERVAAAGEWGEQAGEQRRRRAAGGLSSQRAR